MFSCNPQRYRFYTAACIGLLAATPAWATEGGGSLYIPGGHGPLAGYVPSPGVYLGNDLFIYSGDFAGNRQTQIGGAVVADVRANIVLDLLTPTWVTPFKILGGDLGFAVSIPFGVPSVLAGAVITASRLGRTVGVEAKDAVFNIGDPIATTFVGWHAGNFHWQVGGSVNIPSGSYRDGSLSNVSFNRPIGDIYGALTYLDPALGLDVSGAAGYEINGTNPATNYKSGNAAHIDVAIMKSLTKEFSLGVLAGHYQQVTADRGGAVGSFKGRVTAVGLAASYSFELGKVPISTLVRVLREVEVQNRPQGTIALLTISLPLGGGAATK